MCCIGRIKVRDLRRKRGRRGMLRLLSSSVLKHLCLLSSGRIRWLRPPVPTSKISDQRELSAPSGPTAASPKKDLPASPMSTKSGPNQTSLAPSPPPKSFPSCSCATEHSIAAPARTSSTSSFSWSESPQPSTPSKILFCSSIMQKSCSRPVNKRLKSNCRTMFVQN